MQVFLSYAQEDIQVARRLRADLESMPGASVWMAELNIPPGADWEQCILDALAASRFIVLLLSNHSVSKEGYVQKEVRRALDRVEQNPPGRIVVIPVRIDECRPAHEALRRLNWVDLFKDWKGGVDRLLSVLATGLPLADPDAIPDISGGWISNFGRVELHQSGRRVEGRYEEDGQWHGTLSGEIDQKRVVFQWRSFDGSAEGMGAWRHERGLLVGGWFVPPQSFTFDALRSANDEKLKDLVVEYPWVLGRYRDSDGPNEPQT